MKRINLFLTVLFSVFLFVITACTHIEKVQEESAFITINHINSGARTINPAGVSYDFEGTFELTGVSKNNATVSENFENYYALSSAKIQVVPDTWIFTLKIKDSNAQEIYNCSTEVTVGSGENNVEFEIPFDQLVFNDGEGEITLYIDTSYGSGVNKIKVELYDEEENHLSEYDDVVYYMYNYSVPAGSYTVKIYLYNSDGNLIQSYEEVINVAKGMESEKDINFSNEDLNKIYKITYDYAGGALLDKTTKLTSTYTRLTENISLPDETVISKTDSWFVGWKDDEENLISEINTSSCKDITVHAVWTNERTCIVEEFSDLAKAIKKGPVTFKLTDVTDSTIADVGTVLKAASRSAYINLDLSDCEITKIPSEAFYDAAALSGIILPETITEIGASAFYKTYITSIVVPENVIKIEQDAFGYCNSLKDIYYNAKDCDANPNNEAWPHVFYATSAIERSLVIGKEVVCIPAQLFEGSNILDVTFEEGSVLEEIGQKAFQECSKITELDLPASLKKIGKMAFYRCTKLNNLVLPEGIESLEDFAFSYCKAFTEFTVPSGVTDIGNEILSYCINIETVYYNAVECSSTYSTSLFGPYTKTSENLTVQFGDSVKIIPNSLLRYNTSIKEIVIPDSVEVIQDQAFRDCSNLEKIVIGSGVKEIDRMVLGDCSNLSTVVYNAENAVLESALNCDILHRKTDNNIPISVFIGNTVKKIPEGLFYNTFIYKDEDYLKNPEIINVTFEDGSVLEEIENFAFYGIETLTEITIPASVTKIGGRTFDACKNLSVIRFEDVDAIWVYEKRKDNQVVETVELNTDNYLDYFIHADSFYNAIIYKK